MDGPDSETLGELRERVLELRKEGRDDEAVLAAEKSLCSSVEANGPFSASTRETATDLVLAYNHVGMKRLARNDVKGSFNLLQKAQLLTGRDQQFLGHARLQARAVTLNNLGCLMKKWGKPRVGISLIARALRIEAGVPGGAENPAGTHLNMSVALSAVGKHVAASVHAEHAIRLASEATEQMVAEVSPREIDRHEAPQDARHHHHSIDDQKATGSEVAGNSLKTGDSASGTEDFNSMKGDDGRDDHEVFSATLPSRGIHAPQGRPGIPIGSTESSVNSEGCESIEPSGVDSAAGSLLAIAHFNLAVEREHLGDMGAALQGYENAHTMAAEHLGPESSVTKGIEGALESASANARAAATTASRRTRRKACMDSFPSIGKLVFSPRANDASAGGRTQRSRRRRRVRQPEDYDVSGELSQARLRRAYDSPRPCRPSRASTWAQQGRPHSHHRAAAPQRAGRWTNPVKPPRKHPSESSQSWFGGEEGLYWRAQACSQFNCSPREARGMQQADTSPDPLQAERSHGPADGLA